MTKVSDRQIIIGENPAGQELASPHICSDGSLLLAYGGPIDSPHPTVGDRIHAIDPATGLVTQVMSYAPIEPQCINYLGAGAGLARGPDGRYFALVPVEDRERESGWIAWASSRDGLDWYFLARDGSATKDPLQSFTVIARRNLAPSTANGLPSIWHPAMIYNDLFMTFDISFGYAHSFGITATWWSIQYEPAMPMCLGKIFRKSFADGALIDGNIIPDEDAWVVESQWPEDAVDPMEIVSIERGERRRRQRLFFYLPAANAFDCPTPIAYRVWGEPPALLDTSPVWAKWNPAPANPAGNYLTAYQTSPNTLRGYIAASKEAYALGGQGLVEVEIEMREEAE